MQCSVCTLEHLACSCPCPWSLGIRQWLRDALRAGGKSDLPAEEEAALHGRWGNYATPSCCSPVQFSTYLSVQDEDFQVDFLNLPMFCSCPAALDMVVAAVGGLWLVVIWTFWFAGLKIRKVGHPASGIAILSISCDRDHCWSGPTRLPRMTREVSVLNCTYFALYSFWTVTCCIFLSW